MYVFFENPLFSTLPQHEIKSACSGMSCLGICYEKAWNNVESVLQKLHRLVWEPERNLRFLAECFKEGKNHAFSLSTHLLRHSLLNPYNRRDWMTILDTWVTL